LSLPNRRGQPGPLSCMCPRAALTGPPTAAVAALPCQVSAANSVPRGPVRVPHTPRRRAGNPARGGAAQRRPALWPRRRRRRPGTTITPQRRPPPARAIAVPPLACSEAARHQPPAEEATVRLAPGETLLYIGRDACETSPLMRSAVCRPLAFCMASHLSLWRSGRVSVMPSASSRSKPHPHWSAP
jgi:hypothetical protein